MNPERAHGINNMPWLLLVPLDCAGRAVIAVVDQIRTVAKERLQQRLGAVSAGYLKAVEEGLRQILEL